MAETASDLRERHLLSPLSYAHEADLTNFPKHESVTQAKENELHDGLKFGHYMLAGSVAGMVEHMAMFPVDTLKTRMQMLASAGGSRHSTVSRALVSIVKSEGAVGLYRGIGAMGLGAGPAHAVYFSVYEVCKHKLGGNEKGYHPLAHGTAGALATVASDAVFTPMDVVKQRLQLKHTPYRGLTHCIATMLRVEGFGAFYTSYPTTVVMNVPFTAVHFASYEAAKKLLMEVSPDKADEEHLLVHVTAGGAAGALASAVTTPLDVVKTRLQCQGVSGAQRFMSCSVVDAVRRIVAEEGLSALLRGLRPRVLFHTPAAAICWSTYEADVLWFCSTMTPHATTTDHVSYLFHGEAPTETKWTGLGMAHLLTTADDIGLLWDETCCQEVPYYRTALKKVQRKRSDEHQIPIIAACLEYCTHVKTTVMLQIEA